MTTVLNHGRLFQLKFFNRLSIKSVTIYRPNESKIYIFNGNGNNSIWANDGLPYFNMGWPKCPMEKHFEYANFIFIVKSTEEIDIDAVEDFNWPGKIRCYYSPKDNNTRF